MLGAVYKQANPPLLRFSLPGIGCDDVIRAILDRICAEPSYTLLQPTMRSIRQYRHCFRDCSAIRVPRNP